MQDAAYRVVVGLIRRLVQAGAWVPAVEGAENVPASGPAVLAFNHISYLDFIFAAWSPAFDRGRFVRFLAKKEVFDDWWSGPFMRAMGHIPVDRKNEPSRALHAAVEALGRGEVIGAFLEGSVNRTLQLGRGKTGAVRMAQATGAPLIPGALWGTHRIWTEGEDRKLHRRVPIVVKIGPPVYLDPSEDPRQATDRVMEMVGKLLDRAKAEDPAGPSSAP